MKKLYLTIIVSCLIVTARAQIGASYQFSTVHPNFGFSYGVTNQWWGELRLATDVSISNFSTEIVGAHNFISSQLGDFYGAIGVKINLLTGPMAMAGMNIYPFQNKHIGFLFESGFIYDTGADEGVLRGLVGLRYNFIKPEKNP